LNHGLFLPGTNDFAPASSSFFTRSSRFRR
jgi:hypothetical protein